MRLIHLVSVIVALAVSAPAPAAEITATPGVEQASAPLPAAFTAKTIKRSNVRFGPNIGAKVVAILPVGEEVAVIGPAFAKGWYEIRFPRQGHAWVHERNVVPLDDGKRWQVIKQDTRVRDDSTLGAAIVKELAVGEILEDKGQKIGQWHAVYVPNASAYIYKDNILLPADPNAALAGVEAEKTAARQQWELAAKTYAAYWDILQKNFEAAAVLDWDALSGRFAGIARSHPDSKVRVESQRLVEVIAQVTAAAGQYRKAHPDLPPAPAIPPVVLGSQQPKPGDGGEPAAGDRPAVAPPIALQQIKPPAVAAAPVFAAEGMLEQHDYASVGAGYHLIDPDGNVRAFIKLADGSTIQLSEYVWSPIGVKGASEPIAPEKHALGSKPIPLVTVDEVVLRK